MANEELNLSSIINADNSQLNRNEEQMSDKIQISPVLQNPEKTFNLTAMGGAKKNGVRPVSSQRSSIDPAQLGMPRKQEEKGKSRDHMKEKALSELDAAITRKHKEAEEALQILDERDQANRIAVAEGLESVEKEIIYKAPEKSSSVNGEDKFDSEDDFDAMLEQELNETERNAQIAANAYANKQVRVANNIFDMNNDDLPRYEEPEDLDEELEEDDDYEDENIEIVMGKEEYEDRVVDTTVKESTPVEKEEEKIEEKQNENELAHQKKMEDMFTKNTKVVKPAAPLEEVNLKDVSKDDFNIDPEDFADVDELSEEEIKSKEKEQDKLAKEGLSNLRNEILDKIVNTANKFNVSTFRISKKTTSLQEVLNKSKKNKLVKSTATWALMNVGRPYTSSALTGPEIVMMATADEGQNSPYISNQQQLRVLYNHDENPFKPATFESWCKTIPYSDIDEMFMAAFVATFNKANYLPYTCENNKCMNMELKDQPDIRGKMVKFKNDKVKERFESIVNTPCSPENSIEYETVVVPINDSIAIGFKLPSIYNMLIELRSVSPKFLEKYAAIVTVIAYIDTIYMVKPDTEEFSPVDYKQYPGDVAKTFKSKIANYARILNTFDTNEFNVLIAYTNSIGGKENDITYVVPEEKCSKCNHVIEERQTTGKDLVFTQQRLVDIATISIE